MQRLELYIAGQKADIGTDAPVLFNYTAEELNNPTIVKNSYSQQLNLMGTAANDRIFQCYFRADAMPGVFNPSKRVPFQIFADRGRIIESGYVKLDSVTQTGNGVQYAVTLFGGLGGFLYSLQYNDEKVRSLADLLYTDGNGDAITLDFTINRAAVAEAWQNAYTEASKWSLINFAPCYNGLPDKFDPGRALVLAAKYGLETEAGDDPDSPEYTARSGFAVVDLPGDMNEWQVKDLRSYLQRPVISARAVLRAICDPDNNGGYDVTLDDAFFNEFNPHYYSAWMTLKRLTALKLPTVAGVYETGRVEASTQEVVLPVVATADARGAVTVEAGIAAFNIPAGAAAVGDSLFWYGFDNTGGDLKSVTRGLIMQAVGYDESGNAVCGSKVVAFGPNNNWTCQGFCSFAHYTPAYDTGEGDAIYADYIPGDFKVTANGVAEWQGAAASLTIPNAARIATVKVVTFRAVITQGYYITSWPYLQTIEDVTSSLDTDRVDVDTAVLYGSASYDYESSGVVRSGVEVSQASLLSDTMSPAEFLLSYCKRYGLCIRVDRDRKHIYIEKRGTVYEDTTVTDLSDRVDRGRDVKVTPVSFAVQKFELSEESIGAGYGDEYKSRFGVEYGVKRLNTGYEFNAEVKKLLSGSKFKSAPEVKARDLCFLTVNDPGQTPATWPAVFLNSGLKYHLFAENNRDTNDITVPSVPASVVYEYWDDTYRTYDDIPRLQLCDSEGKGKDGDGVLVFFQGHRALPAGFYLSDDLPEMYLGNNENPCWVLEARDAFGPAGDPALLAPCFGRFRYSDSKHTQIAEMVEFGAPMELDIPGAVMASNIDVYAVFWKAYLGDRYSPATKVMECYVNVEGLGIPVQEMLRRFYHIDGSLWVLNKISSYDLNSVKPVKCEFVQVQDVNNYQ